MRKPTISPTRISRTLACQPLENRLLLTSLHESQLFLYLLNEARHDPASYQARMQQPIDLSGLVPRQPLAINPSLTASAQFHSAEMATHNYFSHVSAISGRHPNGNALDNGYPLPSFWERDANYIESIAAGTLTASAGRALEQLTRSPSHRAHLFGENAFFAANREGGVGYAFDPSSTYSHYWTVHLARAEPTGNFLTGVVFEDANQNQQYDLREGIAGATVTIGGQSVLTNEAGGWALPVPANESLTVMVQHPDWTFDAVTQVDAKDLNVQLDFQYLPSSGSILGRESFGDWQEVTDFSNIPGPTAIELNWLDFDAGQPGAILANLAVVDPITDQHTISVNDPRFVVQEGILRLLPGVALTWLDAPDLDLQVTATDAQNPERNLTRTITLDLSDLPLPPMARDGVLGTFWGESLLIDLGPFIDQGTDPLDSEGLEFLIDDLAGDLEPVEVWQWQFTAAHEFVGETSVLFRIADVAGRTSDWSELTIHTVASPLQNPLLHADVDGDGHVRANDALLVINRLNRAGQTRVPISLEDRDHFYLDVNGDLYVDPLDALLVINALNRMQRESAQSLAPAVPFATRIDPLAVDVLLGDLQGALSHVGLEAERIDGSVSQWFEDNLNLANDLLGGVLAPYSTAMAGRLSQTIATFALDLLTGEARVAAQQAIAELPWSEISKAWSHRTPLASRGAAR